MLLTKKITHKPLFWIFLTLFSVSCAYFAYTFFPKTFSIINLDITMDRDDALKKAKEIAQKLNLGPTEYQQSASFDVDDEAKNYIELEAGGPKRFSEIIDDNFYSPYLWIARHFQEEKIKELYIYFTPEGIPTGYEEIIPEDEPGPALSSDNAKKIALKNLKEDWNIKSDKFQLVEESQEKQPNGRLDYSFTYEALEKKEKEAPYRLIIEVKGDKRTKVALSIKVPESFQRRYAHMRSYNENISSIAQFVLIFLYVFLGILGGLFFLSRQRQIQWRTPIKWGAFITFMQILSSLNTLPLLWMNYPTSLSKYVYLSNFLVGLVYNFIFYFSTNTLIIMAAESLSRVAFPYQPQLWKSWSIPGANSFQIAGRTIGGYLMVSVLIAYVIGFYYFTLNYLNWWSPSHALYDPNTLATYLPWLAPVCDSLWAGFFEECLTRAVPLSCAALLGNRFGKRNWWIAGAFILQAIVFAAAHGFYATQPFYARLVELILPSFIFGGIFLLFGLLPGIITHFVYDVVWGAIPIFISTASGIWIQKLLVIACCLVPLFVVLYARLKTGRWISLPATFYNGAWQPPAIQPRNETRHSTPVGGPFLSLKYLVILGFLGLGTWLGFTRFSSDTTPLTISRKQAVEIARETALKNVDNQKEWLPLTGIINPLAFSIEQSKEQHHFVWQKGDKNLYHNLLNSYLIPLAWQVRFVKTSGTVAERAEEHIVFITENGKVLRKKHTLPEDISTKALSEEAAGQLLAKNLLPNYDEKFEEVSAIAEKYPNRQDWKFTYKAPLEKIENGEKRLLAHLIGDEIKDINRFIFVPEEFKRTFHREEGYKNLIKTFANLLFILLLAIAGIFLFLKTSIRNFSTSSALLFGGIILLRGVIQYWNMWPQITMMFQTTQPFEHQAFSIISSLATRTVFKAFVFGTLAGFINPMIMRSKQRYSSIKINGILGIFIGLLFCGLQALNLYFTPALSPLWPALAAVGGKSNVLGPALMTFMNYIEYTLYALALLLIIDRLTDGWQKNRILLSLFIMIASLTSVPLDSTVRYWILSGICLGLIAIILYCYVLRFSKASLPMLMATIFCMDSIQQSLFAAYIDSYYVAPLTFLLVGGFGLYWTKMILEYQLFVEQ